MRIKIIPDVLLAGCLLSGMTVSLDRAKGQSAMPDSEIAQLMSQLDSLDEKAQMSLLSRVDEQRNQLLTLLVRYLDTSPSKNVQAAAIYIIGRHRFSEGTTELVRHIDFDAGERMRSASLPLWDQYPAMEALIRIGLPSIQPTIELLATDSNELRRSLATKVIRYVEGPEVAKFVLDRAYEKESDPKRRANLKNAIARLERLIHDTT